MYKRQHDIFYIRWPNEAVLVIETILRNFLDARVVNRFHKGITVVEEVGTFSRQSFNHCKVTSQGFINQAMDCLLYTSILQLEHELFPIYSKVDEGFLSDGTNSHLDIFGELSRIRQELDLSLIHI